MEKNDKFIISELTKLLLGGSAHISFEEALKGLNPGLRGIKPENMPYSIWQLVEHIRIAQWDMLEFSRDAKHQSPTWPDSYWPKATAPESESHWENALAQIKNDLHEFVGLMQHSDLYRPFPHGNGQSIFREALQIADHNAYHLGEIVTIRRLLGDWN